MCNKTEEEEEEEEEELSILAEMKNQKIRNIRIIAEMTKKYNLEKNPI